ncbi:hypothetical protein ABMA28_004579 [Loxostege sticticalis]|uniref:Ribosomal protein n=1 Tax=Loxostege sticticalis TaxID=481309 RepID=A0ABD0SRQ7_LOXSC
MQRLLSIVKTVSSLGSTLTRTVAITPNYFSAMKNVTGNNLLTPCTPMINPVCNLKIKGRVRRRCKSCYFVIRDERLYVMCPKFPRHKQAAMKPKPINTWILTHASQSKVRPW